MHSNFVTSVKEIMNLVRTSKGSNKEFIKKKKN